MAADVALVSRARPIPRGMGLAHETNVAPVLTFLYYGKYCRYHT